MKKCKHCQELYITEFINTSKEHRRLFKLCFNTTTMVVKTGGVLVQDCVYNRGFEYECPFYQEET